MYELFLTSHIRTNIHINTHNKITNVNVCALNLYEWHVDYFELFILLDGKGFLRSGILLSLFRQTLASNM